MEGSVLSIPKAEWKVSDTGSAQCWASSYSAARFLAQQYACRQIGPTPEEVQVRKIWDTLG